MTTDPVRSTLFVEAFGSVTGESAVDADEDLWSVFRGRAELMGWLTHSGSRHSVQALWAMHEAELTDDSLRVGFCQVGLDHHKSYLVCCQRCFSVSVILYDVLEPLCQGFK